MTHIVRAKFLGWFGFLSQPEVLIGSNSFPGYVYAQHVKNYLAIIADIWEYVNDGLSMYLECLLESLL
jgi:hypothetical protein